MSNLAAAGLNTVLDIADDVTKAVVVALDETKTAGAATAIAAITVGEKSLDVALTELEKLREQYIQSARNIATALANAIPGQG